MSRKCLFINLVDNELPKFELATETRVYLGRSNLTEIKDPACSRQQVSVKANLTDGYLLVKHEGAANPTALNGFVLESHKVYEVNHGDVLELLHNNYKYRVEFDPPPPIDREISTQKSPESKKPRMDNITPATENKWDSVDHGKLLIFTAKGVVARSKIASYDMDGTIIKTKSGNVFPKSIDDWQIAFAEVPGKLKSLYSSDFKIVFFTNQAGISKGKTSASDFKKKVERIVQKLNVPIQAFVATGSGKYRKPLTGMYDVLCTEKNDGVEIDKSRSFFCGDAAGRPEQKNPVKRRKDHSLADRLLALNLEIPFFTPEQHFQKQKDSDWVKPDFNPKDMITNAATAIADKPIVANDCEVAIMVGFPGSGKSQFAKTQLETAGYRVINRDKLGSWQKCVDVLEKTLTEGKQKCVIDNTNPDAESRTRFIQVAKKFKIPCRAFVMNVSYKHCRHNNAFRELIDPNHAQVNDMVFNMYKSKYQEPKLAEGFSDIVKVNFVPSFQDEAHEKLYKLYLLEK